MRGDAVGGNAVGGDAVRGALVLFRASAAVAPFGALDAARRVVLADRLLADRETPSRATCILTCLLADVGAVLATSGEGLGARRSGSLLASVPGLESVASAIDHRHERVDGSGYPRGLSGGAIPFAARLTAICDVLVGKGRHNPIDWSRRIEVMKDNAGGALDVSLARAAHDILEDSGVRAIVEHATADDAIAIAGRLVGPDIELVELAKVLGNVAQPFLLASDLLRRAWPATVFSAVGCGRLDPDSGRVVDATAFGPHIGFDLGDVISGEAAPERTSIVPVAHGDGRPWGALWGHHGGGRPRASDTETLELIGSLVTEALTRVAREAELTAQALRDQLTGLANRRSLETELAAAYAAPPEVRADMAVVMCDVDGLKLVNDTRGHAAGDDVLRAVAAVLESALEGIDGIAARLGGDEFCLVLRSGGILHAQTVARRATAGVLASVAGDVGLSCGIAYAARAATPAELLSGADLAQYQIKRQRPGFSRRGDPVPGRRRRRDR